MTKLEKKLFDLERCLQKMKEQRKDEKNAIMRSHEIEVEKHVASVYDEHIAAVAQSVAIARQAELDERERLAVDKAPFPIGTKMVEWGTPARWFSSKGRPWEKTGRVGVIELITQKSQHPKTTTCSRASVGSFVIRLLKKDGTPSLNYVATSYSGFHGWHPEGKQPKGDTCK